jgi:hypothetical protein
LSHLGDGRDFVGVCFDAAFDDDVPQEIPSGASECAFFWAQLNVKPLEVVEGFFKIRDEDTTLSGFYHDIIDIDLEVTPYLLLKAKLHTSLICSPCVL